MSRQALIVSIMLVIGACSYSDKTLATSELAILELMCLTPPAANNIDYMLWGKYEVSNSEYYSDAEIKDADIPVVQISFYEAQAWCDARGLRLPSQDEWIHLLSSNEVGPATVGARNDLDLGINRPLPGGVFERGRVGWGVYDLYSNVREWASESSSPPSEAIAVGASFASRSNLFKSLAMNKQDSASDVGFRYAVNAVAFLEKIVARQWPTLNSTQRKQATMAIAGWKADWRIALANRLDEALIPRSLMQALRQ
ncbi:MAG: hypothetical protein ACI84O_000795 [Myxococcota bacterium]|jgi:hypothetical protein